MKKKILIVLIVIIAIILLYGVYYVNDFYHADESVSPYLNGIGNVSVVKTSTGLLIDGKGNDSALIFYPGAKVEYASYLPLLTKIADSGVDCYLVEMPYNLAILGKDTADSIINGTYKHYFLAGHSLGGAMASDYVNSTNKSDGLILLESYSTCEISKPVLSIYGTQDKVLNMDKYNESKGLVKNLTEIVIKGGNHAQVGNYGSQSGDGNATITPDTQQDEIAREIINFIRNI